MPAGSETGPAPQLPVRLRPLGVRLASLVLVVLLVGTAGGIWLAFPQEVRDQFTAFQLLTVFAMGAVALVCCHAMSRCRVDATAEGLTVVNGYRTHRLDWGEVVAVSLRPGNPWAVLDLSDGTAQPALGIQGSDGVRAQRQVRLLRRLVEARAGRDPH